MNKINDLTTPGFYFIYLLNEDGTKKEVSLVKIYKPIDADWLVVGFGTWDGCAAVPISDIDANSYIEPLHDINGVVNKELLALAM